MANRYLVQLLLLAVIRPADAGGPVASGTKDCPGTNWKDTLDPTVWGGHMPGDVTTNLTTYPGGKVASYPAPPPACMHGAGTYVGWTATNGFTRHFTVAYDTLALFGEAKHGLWQWAVAGAGPQAPIIWWCQLGGNADPVVHISGHMDDGTDSKAANQAGMEAVWEQVRKSPAAFNEVGPLAIRAKLKAIASTAIRVNHVTGSRTWMNRGNASKPYWRPLSEEAEQASEVYVFEGNYKWPNMFAVEPCGGDASNATCGLRNTFIAVVTERAETENVVGLTTSGLHYGPDGDLCPERCGAGECKCNALLSDLAVHAFLGNNFTTPLSFLPKWINPWLGPPAPASPAAASEVKVASTSEVWLPVVTGVVALVMGLLVGFGAAVRFRPQVKALPL